jgi:hypothetical protein
VLVAVTAPPDVRLLHRARLDILADGDPKQPWHAAQHGGLSPAQAVALADRVEAGARKAAVESLGAAVAAVDGEVVAAAVIGEPKDVPPPERVLARHLLLHLAEGELYRSVLADAADELGLAVVPVPVGSVSVDAHAPLLAAMGKAAGRPWQADHKLAVAAALLAF